MCLVVYIFYLRPTTNFLNQNASFDRNVSKNENFSFTFVYIINLRIIKAIHDRSLEKFQRSIMRIKVRTIAESDLEHVVGAHPSSWKEAAVSGVQTVHFQGVGSIAISIRIDREHVEHGGGGAFHTLGGRKVTQSVSQSPFQYSLRDISVTRYRGPRGFRLFLIT